MIKETRVKNLILPFLVLALGFFTAYSIAVYAQEFESTEPAEEKVNESGIQFPIPELGNCGSKDECRDYCDKAENMEVCIVFAKSRGLMNKSEAERAEKFRRKMEEGQTPGGCNSPQSCEAFCGNINNIESCIKFVEENDFDDEDKEHIQQGRKILEYIKSGGELPGGCDSKDSCEAYCGDFDHAEECFAFAQKLGIGPGAPPGQFGKEGELGSGWEQIRKFIELAKKGETPGGCKSKDQCEAYCRNQSHFEECVDFISRAGFINPEEAEKIKKIGGKGPGGCSSPEECRVYCSEPAHQEECFKFAEEHGFIKEEEISGVKEVFVRMRAGLENAPADVRACLRSALGTNIIDDVQAGKLAPGREISEKMRTCFKKFGEKVSARELFDDAPPEVAACIKKKIGDTFDNVKAGEIAPTSDVADAFRVCFQKVRFLEPPVYDDQEGGEESSSLEMLHSFIRSAPPGVAECVKEKVGDEIDKIKSGKIIPSPDLKEKMRSCFETFVPENQEEETQEEEFYEGEGGSVPPRSGSSNGKPGVDKSSSENLTLPESFSAQEAKPEFCIQIETFAKDPATGACKSFTTPCDVPYGWEEVLSCSQTSKSPESSSAFNAILAPLLDFFK